MLEKKFWKKGGGEFVGYMISMVAVLMLLIFSLGIFTHYRASGDIDEALQLISREVVVCESLDEAKILAEDRAHEIIGNTKVTPGDSIEVDVEYTMGSERTWEKGNFITIYLSADINNMFTGNTYRKYISEMAMIENTGGSE